MAPITIATLFRASPTAATTVDENVHGEKDASDPDVVAEVGVKLLAADARRLRAGLGRLWRIVYRRMLRVRRDGVERLDWQDEGVKALGGTKRCLNGVEYCFNSLGGGLAP